MILAWSRERIVLAFRGTASLSNVVADLQVPASAPTEPPQQHDLSRALSLCLP